MSEEFIALDADYMLLRIADICNWCFSFLSFSLVPVESCEEAGKLPYGVYKLQE